MKKYYLHNGTGQEGPLSLEEIKRLNLLPGTLVWTEGMDTWTEAKGIPELSNIVAEQLLPSLSNNDTPQSPALEQRSRARKNRIFIIAGSLALCIAAITFLFFNTNNDIANTNIGTGEEQLAVDTAVVLPQSAIEPVRLTKEEQEQLREKEAPEHYLAVSTYEEKNLLLQLVIKGTLYNKAAFTTYEHVKLKVTYKGKDGIMIGEEFINVEDRLKPKDLFEIRHKPSKKAYRKAFEYAVTLSNAHPVE